MYGLRQFYQPPQKQPILNNQAPNNVVVELPPGGITQGSPSSEASELSFTMINQMNDLAVQSHAGSSMSSYVYVSAYNSEWSVGETTVSDLAVNRNEDMQIEVDDEEDSFFDDSYREPTDDARSMGSRSAASMASRRSFVSGQERSRGRNSRRPGQATTTSNAQRQARDNANANSSQSDSRSKGSDGGSGNGRNVPREIDLSGDELEDVSYSNVSNDTSYVKDKQIVDQYGEKGVYTGELSKSTCMPNGRGRLEYEKEGRWYEGDWIHGRWTGSGCLGNGDDDFYEGGFKNDHKHGEGIMKFADGRIFEGEYIRGQMIQGKMTYQNGSVYDGSWVDGMRHGKGKCIFVDGSGYDGEFREGKIHGHGKMTWNDGGWYVGEWCNGEMHGRGKEIRPSGSLRHDGEWARGQPIQSAADS